MQFGYRFQILLFTTSERFSTKTLAYLAYKAFKAFMAFKRSRLNRFQKLPLNNIFQCGLAAIDTTCICVCKYFARLRHNAPGDRNPNTLKYKTSDQRVFWLLFHPTTILSNKCRHFVCVLLAKNYQMHSKA